ncbi:short-chain dehydrogenase/reductase SDR [Parvibaculum lavamentivorans DS-1]|uniref:Short-chain dehydrogenase/reductase SDR n=1 Tax=Parvibaculum lavamentivorans (strain DS-1 / DSM 13023 / NCIMB 13966) TaxID=402881 RepID=A7HS75_PARL1|nr:glucose 1-dehydrogenase [Parvibaculum lavamentivorans]ABS62758.1 short-chain dehydrogenase/reductase SDR [Parvibaculum lavamentivorans DS-1]
MAAAFDGKIILVTGASAGIGRAIAEAAAREGASLALGDIAEAGEEVAVSLRSKGAKAFFLRTDVRRKSDLDALVARAKSEFGSSPHVAFANAGVEGRLATPWEPSEEEFLRVMDTNVVGAWRTMAAVLPGMIAQGQGAIVATASVAGLVGAGGLAAYVASKHGVVGLVKSVAIDVAKSGIRVNALCPGMIETAMVDRLADDMPGFREALLALKPMGRLGVPSEAAEAAIWLASPAASFVTGHALAVDGGYVAQ